MTLNIHKSHQRGTANYGWLKPNYSFSFSNYHNPNRMGFGALRVFNDDIIAPHSGFPEHPHKNMEIITLVLSGELTHTDSMGNNEVLYANDMQIMSAGSGVVHSEYNHSNKPINLFQMWIHPDELDIEPSHKTFSLPDTVDEFIDVVPGIKPIKQDASLLIGTFTKDQTQVVKTDGYGIFLMVIDGSVVVNGEKLNARDSVETTDDMSLEVTAGTRLLVFKVRV